MEVPPIPAINPPRSFMGGAVPAWKGNKHKDARSEKRKRDYKYK